jgi:hypothetical protein
VKRKRKEHRSLDSVLFEDDAELEYFDVLSLLPLSNVRLEYGGADSTGNGNNLAQTKKQPRDPRELECEETASSSEERCSKEWTVEETTSDLDDYARKLRENFDSSRGINSSRQTSLERERPEHRELQDSLGENSEINASRYEDRRASSLSLKVDQERHALEVEALVSLCEEDRGIEDAQEYRSIWITDREERGEMSRRPQILKVVDNDVTRRRHRRSVVEIDAIVEDVPEDKRLPEITKEESGRVDATPIKSADTKEDRDHEKGTKVGTRVQFRRDR